MTRSRRNASRAQLALPIAVLTGVIPVGAAHAQGEVLASLRPLAANELGALEFCQAQGFVDGDAVADQRNAIARFPPAPAGSPSTDAAEALGRTGKVWFATDMPAIMRSLGKNGGMLMGPDMATLEQFAESHRVTVRLVCEQAAYNAKLEEEEAHRPPRPNGALPRLPAMPFGLPDARVFTPRDVQELQQLRTTRH